MPPKVINIMIYYNKFILDDLVQYFQVYGEIIDCMIMYDKITGKPRGKLFPDEKVLDLSFSSMSTH